MGKWNHRVNKALDAFLAAQLAETSLRKQLEIVKVGDAVRDADELKRLWRQTRDEAAAARARVDDVLWTGPLDERQALPRRL